MRTIRNQQDGDRMAAPGQSTARGAATAAVALVLAGAIATILGFFFFQYALGYPPCPLCLHERIPYYCTVILALLLLFTVRFGAKRGVLAVGLVLIAIAMLIGAGMGIYHAGVEWKWWAGPTDCSGPLTNFGSAGNLMQTIQSTRVVRCDEAAWRFLGISLAGYNVIVSLVLAAVALWGAVAAVKNRD
jgi:disulfide bond formation protein DsbB